MRLRKFRVRAYRCIHDSGEITVGDLAAFVGRNESGKTTILQALTLLNRDETISDLDLCDEMSEELKEENRVFVKDCVIETDMEILIPTTYVNAVDERLRLYKRLNDINTEKDLITFVKNLVDRFGELPHQTEELVATMRLKWLAQNIGLEKLYMKNSKLRGYFISNANSDYYQTEKFGKILMYVQQNGKTCKMKEIKGRLALTFEKVRSIEWAAQQGLNIIMWIPTVKALKIKFEAFKNAKSEAEKRNVPMGEGISLVRDMFVADTMEEAKEKAGQHMVDYMKWVCHWRGLGNHMDPGEELPETKGKLDLLNYEFLHKRNMLFGTPEYVIDKIHELKSELNLQNLHVWSNFPGIKHQDCMKSIKLFTEKVMPHFKDDIDTEVKKVS